MQKFRIMFAPLSLECRPTDVAPDQQYRVDRSGVWSDFVPLIWNPRVTDLRVYGAPGVAPEGRGWAISQAHPAKSSRYPKGGGAQHGPGEEVSPDLHTGTGNFTVPIAVPPGRNGFPPQLTVVYSTGNGNGLCPNSLQRTCCQLQCFPEQRVLLKNEVFNARYHSAE
jgi:hypothetical protein